MIRLPVIFEILELIYMVLTGTFLYWPIHFLIFLVTAIIVRRILARKYKPYINGLKRSDVKVTVVIPEYNEELDILEKCVKSAVENKPDEIIIVSDDNRKEVEEIGRKYGAKTLNILSLGSKVRLGKRASLALAWLLAKGDIIVQLDSDTIMKPNTVDEIIKPFADPNVAGVQGHPTLFKTGERIPYLWGQLIEVSRDVVCKMLDGQLIVIDGKIAAYRRSYLLKYVYPFLTDSYRGRKVITADDRSLTFLANYNGFKTVYQSTAEAESAAQPTLVKFIYQQLRWARSGYMYLIKDFASGMFFKATKRYRFQSLTYLLAPISFTFAWIQTLIVNVQVVDIIGLYVNSVLGISDTTLVLYSLLVFLIGLILTLNFGTRGMGVDMSKVGRIKLLEYIALGLLGLFVFYPMFLYALATHRDASVWLTR